MHKSSDDSDGPAPDPMNLDDFIMPNSIASPADLTPPVMESSTRTVHRTSAMPIKTKKAPQHSTPSTVTPGSGSVPHPLTRSSRPLEFDYVEKRVRKTSVDERRVSTQVGSFDQWPPLFPHVLTLLSVSKTACRILPSSTCHYYNNEFYRAGRFGSSRLRP
jgi:GATA-binding protein, other eukaryote